LVHVELSGDLGDGEAFAVFRRCRQYVEEFEHPRAVVVEGLDPDQYGETIRILSVMAGNVTAAIASRTAR
jgi:hypothetical protein